MEVAPWVLEDPEVEGGGGEGGLGPQHTVPCRGPGPSGGEVQECSWPWGLVPGPWGSRQGPNTKACGQWELCGLLGAARDDGQWKNSPGLALALPNQTWVCFSSVQFSRSVVSDFLRPHESQHARPPCLSPTPRVYSNSCPSSGWCHPAISSSVVPSPPAPNPSFPMRQLFAWGGQSIGVQLKRQSFQWTPRTDL